MKLEVQNDGLITTIMKLEIDNDELITIIMKLENENDELIRVFKIVESDWKVMSPTFLHVEFAKAYCTTYILLLTSSRLLPRSLLLPIGNMLYSILSQLLLLEMAWYNLLSQLLLS